MARNSEVIRQWKILREIESAHGISIRQMAELTGVTTRTIRRDLNALHEAGFSLYDEMYEGEKRWKLQSRPFKKLGDTGLTLGELSSLYFSRTLMECLAGTPFQDDIVSAFTKLEVALSPRMRAFLDRLPNAIQAKPGATPTRVAVQQRKLLGRLLDAILNQQRVSMRYHSFSSRREKTYEVDPYRLVYAQGGLYLFAYVSEYDQIRTFALDRIQNLSILTETFDIIAELGEAPFPHSMGIHDGTPHRVEIEFTPEAAPYVQERVWHPSQSVEIRPEGSIVLSFNICIDNALRGWVLSFGPSARVRKPSHLASEVENALTTTLNLYGGTQTE